MKILRSSKEDSSKEQMVALIPSGVIINVPLILFLMQKSLTGVSNLIKSRNLKHL
jgi:hypothetical protein